MGASLNLTSNTTTNIIEGYYDLVNQVVSEAYTKVTLTGSAQNTFALTNCGPLCISPGFPPQECIIYGNVTSSQYSNVGTTIQGTTMSSVIDTVKQSLTDKTEQFINNISNNYSPSWATAAINVVINNNENVNSISETIVNSVSSNVSTVCQAESAEGNDIKIVNCGILKGNVNGNQNIIVNNTISCITKQILKVTVDNQVLREAIQAGDNATQNGDDWFTYLIIGIVVIVVLFVIIAAISAFTRKPKPINQSNPSPQQQNVRNRQLPAQNRPPTSNRIPTNRIPSGKIPTVTRMVR